MANGTGREAVVVIHGSAETEQGRTRERLLEGFEKHSRAYGKISVHSEEDIEGLSYVPLAIKDHDDNPVKDVHVFDVYWGDLLARLSDESERKRTIEGLKNILYWIHPRVLFGFKQNIFMSLSMIYGAIALLLWFCVVSVVGTGLLVGFLAALDHPWLMEAAALIDSVVLTIRDNPWYSLLALLVVMAPIRRLVDLLYFVRMYLGKSRNSGPLRFQIRKRAEHVLDRVAKRREYDRITIAAHSFGTILGIDLLAQSGGRDLRFISMGGSGQLLAQRAGWLQKQIDACLNNSRVTEWVDFYSPTDWFSGPSGVMHDERVAAATTGSRYRQESYRFEAGPLARVNGKNHDEYLEDQKVVATILGL